MTEKSVVAVRVLMRKKWYFVDAVDVTKPTLKKNNGRIVFFTILEKKENLTLWFFLIVTEDGMCICPWNDWEKKVYRAAV
jgi:hypothetical protein